MKRLAILFALVFIIPFTVQAEEFRVATYNCKNLFDFHDDPYVREDSLMGLMKGKSYEEVRQLARVIRAVDANIVALGRLFQAKIKSVDSSKIYKRGRNSFQNLTKTLYILCLATPMRPFPTILLLVLVPNTEGTGK